MKQLLNFFSSLKVTVVLLAFSMALIFFGTLAQVQYGIWHTQKLYFESFFVVWSVPEQTAWHDQLFWLHIPLPGGYLLGGLLLINLVTAHAVRFKMTWKKSGIFLVHFGLILLLLGELITDLMSEESQMPVDEGGSSNYSNAFRSNELVFIDRSHPDYDTVHAVPEQLIKSGEVVEIPDSPLSIRTLSFYPNAEIGRATGNAIIDTPATEGIAVNMGVVVNPKGEVFAENDINTATAFVEVSGPDGPLGVWLVSNVIDDRFPPQIVSVGDQSWELAMRFTRKYYPFRVELIDFKHDKYPGTEIPFNYSSEVMVHHNEPNKSQKALIYMNHPLRYEGLTFYQASFANQDTTSIFQVVRNPGWVIPYISVLLMGIGLIVQFGIHFFKFLGKRRA